MKNPLYIAIQTLIDDGRLTGITPLLRLDGEPFVAPDDDEVSPDVDDAWFDDGRSVELSTYGGRKIRAVEDLRRQLESKQLWDAANNLPQFFVSPTDSRLSDEQEFHARENHAAVWMIRGLVGANPRCIAAFSRYTPRFYRKGTTEPDWRKAPPLEEVDPIQGGPEPQALVANHRILVGAWTPAQIGQWAQEWARRFSAGQDTGDTMGMA